MSDFESGKYNADNSANESDMEIPDSKSSHNVAGVQLLMIMMTHPHLHLRITIQFMPEKWCDFDLHYDIHLLAHVLAVLGSQRKVSLTIKHQRKKKEKHYCCVFFVIFFLHARESKL